MKGPFLSFYRYTHRMLCITPGLWGVFFAVVVVKLLWLGLCLLPMVLTWNAWLLWIQSSSDPHVLWWMMGLYGLGVYLGLCMVGVVGYALLCQWLIMRFQNTSMTWKHAFFSICRFWPRLFLWVCINATIGILIRFLEMTLLSNRHPLGRILARLLGGVLGLGWWAMSYFVVPMILSDQATVSRALRASARSVSKDWRALLRANIWWLYLCLAMAGLMALAFYLNDFYLWLGVAVLLLVLGCYRYMMTILIKSLLFVCMRHDVPRDMPEDAGVWIKSHLK